MAYFFFYCYDIACYQNTGLSFFVKYNYICFSYGKTKKIIKFIAAKLNTS